MTVGLIGAGNIARALARGWGEPVLCTDGGSGRAAALAAEVGGEALASNAELVQRADLVVLCHKPAQLEAVAAEIGEITQALVSALGGTSIARLQSAFPHAEIVRVMPNTPVEVRAGVTCMCAAPDAADALTQRVRELFARVGSVVVLPESLMDVATGAVAVVPAYLALIAEAQVDAAVKHGLPSARAGELVVQALAGSALLLQSRAHDTLAVRREVTSPGGLTARGLAVLERAGMRAAFSDALDAVLAGSSK